MNCKDVCGEEEVWFVLSDKKREGRRFLRWAKESGCVWLGGREIDPRRGTDFFTLSVSPSGILANVPALAVVSEQFRGIRRVNFKSFRKKSKL